MVLLLNNVTPFLVGEYWRSGKDTPAQTPAVNFSMPRASVCVLDYYLLSTMLTILFPQSLIHFSRRSPETDREVWTKVWSESLQRVGDPRRVHGGRGKRLEISYVTITSGIRIWIIVACAQDIKSLGYQASVTVAENVRTRNKVGELLTERCDNIA